MAENVAIIYNEPIFGKYHAVGEGGAVGGVHDSVTSVNRALNDLGHEVLTLGLKPPLSLVETELSKLKARYPNPILPEPKSWTKIF